MDLRGSLARWALARPRVLVVAAATATEVRWDVEATIDRRGWRLASSPAETDLLVTCLPKTGELTAAVDVLWSQVPVPRHRRSVRAERVAQDLDAAATALMEPGASRRDDHPVPEALLDVGSGGDAGEHGAGEHEGHGGGHEGHGGGHGDHSGTVAGLSMAGLAPDRDGLALDQLAVHLGPVLPGWPTGLVLAGNLQGDVLSDVEARWADAPGERTAHHGDATGDDGTRHAGEVLALDRLAEFLLVAGWPTAARQARLARDGLRAPRVAEQTAARRGVEVLTRRVERSRALAWSVGGVGILPRPTPAGRPGTQRGAGAGSDAVERIRYWCAVARGEHPAGSPPTFTLAEVAAAVNGMELASARLTVASVLVLAGATASVGADHG